MTEQIKIENIFRNTRKYWYVDGLSEIAGGRIENKAKLWLRILFFSHNSSFFKPPSLVVLYLISFLSI